jgi:hypothetical protein
MDYMHVRGSMNIPAGSRRPGPAAGAEVDVEAARARVAKARATLQQVQDAVEAEHEQADATHARDLRRGPVAAHEPQAPPRRTQVEPPVLIEGLAQTPKTYPWRKNPDGQVRTVAEARLIATEHGVHIPEDVQLVAVDSKRLPKDTFAKYFEKRSHSPSQMISWDEFYNHLDNIPVQLSRDILGSDEAIVAVIGHEMHELNSLRAIFEQRGGSIPAGELRNLVVVGRPGNLHDHAWDVADQLVAKMRGTSTRTGAEPAPSAPTRGTHD